MKHLLIIPSPLHLLKIDVVHECFVLTSESLIRYILRVELSHQMVIELIPFIGLGGILVLSILNIRNVVTLLGCANMHHSTSEIVVIVL